MKVYLAAPWVRKDDAKTAAERLRQAGIEVTSNWLEHEGSKTDSTGITSPLAHIQEQALQDIKDVQRADYLVVLNLERSEGKAVETGVAIAGRIPVISVGARSNIFQTLGLEVETLTDAIHFLEIQQQLLSHP